MSLIIPTQTPTNAALANLVQAGIVRIDLKSVRHFSVQTVVTVNTPSAVTFDSLNAAVLVNQSLTYTAVTSGAAGNLITVEYIDPPGNDVPLSVAVVGTAISVTLATNGSSVITSTGNDVKAAVNAFPAAAALVLVSGTQAGVVTALSATALATGRDSEVEEDGADTVRIPAHLMTTGVKGQLTTTGGLPTGLSTATDYFTIPTAAGYMKFASSLANAIAGTAVTITGEGTGVHTFTPTALAAAGYEYLWSNKPEVLGPDYTYAAADWRAIDAPVSVAASTTDSLQVIDPEYRVLGIFGTLTAGRMTIDNYVKCERY